MTSKRIRQPGKYLENVCVLFERTTRSGKESRWIAESPSPFRDMVEELLSQEGGSLHLIRASASVLGTESRQVCLVQRGANVPLVNFMVASAGTYALSSHKIHVRVTAEYTRRKPIHVIRQQNGSIVVELRSESPQRLHENAHKAVNIIISLILEMGGCYHEVP